jgi:hypothetical protein
VGPVVFVILIAAGMGTTQYKAHKHASTQGSSTTTTAQPKPQLLTVDGLNGLLTATRNHFGDTMGYEFNILADSALLKRADPNNHEISYGYSNGAWGGSFTSAMAADAAVADLSKFDVAAVAARVPGAPQALGMTDVRQTYLNIQGLDDGTLQIYIGVSNFVVTAEMYLNPDGSVKALHPPS